MATCFAEVWQAGMVWGVWIRAVVLRGELARLRGGDIANKGAEDIDHPARCRRAATARGGVLVWAERLGSARCRR